MGVLCWVTGELWGGGSRCPRGPGTEQGTEPAGAAGTRDPLRRLRVPRLLSAAPGPAAGDSGLALRCTHSRDSPLTPHPPSTFVPPWSPLKWGCRAGRSGDGAVPEQGWIPRIKYHSLVLKNATSDFSLEICCKLCQAGKGMAWQAGGW